MSTLKVNNLQVGQDSTATNNLTWFQPGSPDGTIRLGSGNAGSATSKFTFDKDGNLTCVGNINAASILAPIEGTLDDWIIHAGDTNTKFGFPANDTVSIETAGQQNVQVNGTRVLLKSPSGTNTTVRLQHQGNSGYGDIILDRTVNAFIIDNDPGNAGSNGTYFSVKTIGSERLRITSGGQLNLAGNMQFTVATPELEFNNGGPRFRVPSANTLTVHTGGGLGATSNERLRIDSAGRLLLGTDTAGDSTADDLTIANSAVCGITIRSGTSSEGNIFFADGTSGDSRYRGMLRYDHNVDAMILKVTGGERLRITSTGDIQSVNSVQSGGNASSGFKIGSADTAAYIAVQSKSVANGGSTSNAAFQAWLGASNTFRVNANGLIKTSTGVDFSGAQTNTGGMTSETLDAYEEGTFTPAFGGLSSVSYSIQFGRYTRIGRQVFCTATIDATGIDEASNITLTGLPYSATETSDNQQRSTWLLAYGGHITGVSDATARFRSAGSSWQGVKGTASTSYLTGQQLSSSGTINITGSFSYYIA